MKTGSVYVIKAPETLEIKYVGQTKKTLLARLKEHFGDGNNERKCRWLSECIKKGKAPIIEAIEIVEISQLFERESFWIKYYKQQGCDLFNLDAGRKVVDDKKITLLFYPQQSRVDALGLDRVKEIAIAAIEKEYRKIKH